MSYFAPEIGGVRILQYATPTTGQTVTVNNGTTALVVNPAGLLAALTVTFPSAPVDGQVLSISSTQVITTLTLSGTGILSALTAFTANGYGQWVWGATGTSWYRFG